MLKLVLLLNSYYLNIKNYILFKKTLFIIYFQISVLDFITKTTMIVIFQYHESIDLNVILIIC